MVALFWTLRQARTLQDVVIFCFQTMAIYCYPSQRHHHMSDQSTRSFLSVSIDKIFNFLGCLEIQNQSYGGRRRPIPQFESNHYYKNTTSTQSTTIGGSEDLLRNTSSSTTGEFLLSDCEEVVPQRSRTCTIHPSMKSLIEDDPWISKLKYTIQQRK